MDEPQKLNEWHSADEIKETKKLFLPRNEWNDLVDIGSG